MTGNTSGLLGRSKQHLFRGNISTQNLQNFYRKHLLRMSSLFKMKTCSFPTSFSPKHEQGPVNQNPAIWDLRTSNNMLTRWRSKNNYKHKRNWNVWEKKTLLKIHDWFEFRKRLPCMENVATGIQNVMIRG